MKKFLAVLLCLGFAMSGYAATVTYNTTTNWASKPVNDADTVIINGNAQVTLDTDDTATIVRVSNGATDGTLKIDQNYTLTVLTSFQLGTSTGSGVVTQSLGTVTALNVQIGQNTNGLSAASRYYLSGGQITSTGTVTVGNNAQLNISGGKMISSALTANSGGAVNLTGGVLDMAGTLTAHGAVTINGGTLSNNIAGVLGVGRTIAGTGAVNVQSGDFVLSGDGNVTNAVKINVAMFEVSGGNVDLGGQVQFASGVEMKVVGDAATINMFRLNDLNSNTFRFVFNSNGISTINSPGYIKLTNATIIVDGSNYTGAAGTVNLFIGTSLFPVTDTNNIQVSGFDSYGGAYVTQTTNSVQLTIGSAPSSFELTGSAVANGTVSPTNTSVTAGDSAIFTITADPYYRIDALTTNGVNTGLAFNNLSTSYTYTWTNVQSTGTLAATFTVQVTTNAPAEVPYTWLAGYGITNNQDEEADLDPDLDGLKTWQEYIANTDPTNAVSVLKAAQTARNVITWTAQPGRTYSVHWSTNLVQGFTNLANNATSPYTNAMPDARVNHYQVKVRMP